MLPKNIRSLWVETAPDKAIARARKFIEKGRLDAAASALKDALETGGENARLRVELSQILLRSGHAREAAEGLKIFLKSRPDDHHQIAEILDWAKVQQLEAHAVHEVLAEHHVARREFGAALEALERVGKEHLRGLLDARTAQVARLLEKTPGSVPRSALPFFYLTALTHEAMADDAKALEAYRRIVGAVPGEMKGVEERLRAIVARQYRNVPLRTALAEIYLAAGEPLRAIEEYAALTEVEPRACPLAASALEKIVETEPDPSDALWGLARVRRREGKLEDLLRTAGRLLAAGKHEEDLLALLEEVAVDGKADPRVHLLIGEAAARAGKPSRATAAFSAAANHASAEIRARAREGLERLCEATPDETRAAEALADHAIRDGRLDDAVRWLGRLADRGDVVMGIASRLQTILLSQPGHAGAEELLERIAPALEDARLAAAFLRRRLRLGPEEARAAAERITGLLAQDPRDPEVRIAAAEATCATGDPAGAWAILKPLIDATAGPDPALFHLMVLIGSSSATLCTEVSETFRSMAPALAGSPEGLFALGEMAARAGAMAEALDRFRAAAAFSPAAAAEVIDAVKGLCGTALSGEAAVALAEVLLDAGDFAGAAAIFATVTELPASSGPMLARLEQAMRAQPDNHDLRIAFAAALAASGKAAHGRRLIEEGLRRAGDAAPPSLWLAAGDAWLREGNLTESVRAFSRVLTADRSLAGEVARRLEGVLQTDVGHAGAHVGLGRALLLDGRSREGVNALLTAWSIRPAIGEAILKDLDYALRAFPLEPQVDLARAQMLMGQGDVEGASEALGEALRASPTIASEVLQRLQGITRSHPSCARAHFHAARAWQIRGRVAEASSAFAAAAGIDASLAEPASAALAELEREAPDSPAPRLARARLWEAQGNLVSAAAAYFAAIEKGASADETLTALHRLASADGPHRGRALLAFARASSTAGRTDDAAAALAEVVSIAPDLVAQARADVASLVERNPGSGRARLARATVALAALDPEEALPELEIALTLDPGLRIEVAALVAQVADGGADAVRCAWVRTQTLVAGADWDAAATILETWIPRADAPMRARMCLLRARVERRRGDAGAAKRWMAEAERLAADRESFLAAAHADAVAASRAALARPGTNGDRWRALRAALDLGDAAAAERIAGKLGIVPPAAGTRPDPAGVEALARIAALRGRWGAAAALLAGAPPSELKGHVLARAGRLVEAAACLADLSPADPAPAIAVRGIYARLAAREFLGDAGAIAAETRLTFDHDRESGLPTEA